ncbi:glycoside hydrolase family 2 TIM barrel-domain containing protein [Lachnotalea glycerini]|uniref:DUF4982 domain-containing protein n=1 Tax=Lachnotalea glycerini TaxID=1763509 RepID=A0A371JHH1_9FIRM|nr:glycoside hydrolase family 2 TIM barrel-domain containing protein [Lachnotalea glycerini]RDY32185.1 DUF4982 domain-containing protein [Lachnotalea glycerini]
MSIKQYFNTDWKFTKQKIGQSLSNLDSLTIQWTDVDLPHDWLIYGDDLYETSEGWYQKDFYYTSVSNQLLSLCFDGVYMDSTLFINHKEVGTWPYGYSSFEYEITPYLMTGKNDIKLRVKHEHPNSRWYSGAGIYRNVWLKSYAMSHFIENGIYISTNKKQEDYSLIVSHEISQNAIGTVRHTLLDANEKLIMSGISSDVEILIRDIIPWTLEKPYLYTLRSELLIDDVVVDTENNRFGFRSITFDCNQGFFLNGVHTKLNGVCQHHDLGALGSAFHKTAAKRQLLLLKQMGANAIRTSHNMPAPELLALTDEIGFLVIDEAFDMWERSKTAYDYARFFKEHCVKDVKSWIRRDRNHPSVIMWSIGNEIYDTHADEHGMEITQALYDEVKTHDSRNNAYVTIASNYMTWENARKCANIVKLAGYNYTEKLYQEHHKKYPDWAIYGSETSSLVQSRGIYHFPLNEPILCEDDEQCSSLGNSTTSWGAKSMESCILSERDTPFSMGQFIWTGFDYIGEPTPYHTRNSYFGQIDTAGFPKDSFYFYQSSWTSYKENPMIHISTYWDFNPNQLIDVRIMSNAPKIELFLNDISLGCQHLEHQIGTKLIGDWQIPYERGHLHAVAFDESNQIIASDDAYSFDDAATIELTANKQCMTANAEDLVFVTIRMMDAQGHPVENANNRVYVKVEGAGRLVGLDNGDSTDSDSYKGSSRKLFSGKLLAMVASTLESGSITINVTSIGLPMGQLKLNAVASPNKPVASALLSSFESIITREIPVRKIELISRNGQTFTKDHTRIIVEARIYPMNASYHDINWQVTNASGVAIQIASVKSLCDAEHLVEITAHGDGDFRLRASCKNGGDHAQIISSLEFSISGLGSLTLNPYQFISGSLYSSYEGEISNGNERGVATSRDSLTCITYDNLDFGEYGSDTLTLPIFELESTPAVIRFYEGKRNTEKLLGSFIYDKETIWNVYQDATYILNQRLSGITSLTIEVERKIHIKGFCFLKKEKAFEKIYVKEANHIYGDTFTISSHCVEGIGNNVSLEFKNMDFGNRGAGKVIICGRCPIDRNTIQIHFHNEAFDSIEIAELNHSDHFEVQTFDIRRVFGMQTVTFVFLPGSNFDFQWFRFE